MHLAHNLQLPPMPPGESLPSPNPAASPLTTPTQLCTANGNSCDSSKPKMGLVQMKFSVAAEDRATGLLPCPVGPAPPERSQQIHQELLAPPARGDKGGQGQVRKGQMELGNGRAAFSHLSPSPGGSFKGVFRVMLKGNRGVFQKEADFSLSLKIIFLLDLQDKGNKQPKIQG